jgi:uncharacterized membrane protein YgcG
VAGFNQFTLRNLDKGSRSFLDNIQRNIRYMSIMGMRWDSKIIKQSKAIGISEIQEDSMYSLYGQHQMGAAMDINQKEFIAFFDKEYPTRRDFLRRFAMNGEIEHVIEVIADETIILDDANFFAYPNTKKLKSVLKAEKAKEIVDDLNESFKKIYYAFGFNTGHDGWHYAKKFLIDGFLAFEIIYDGEGADDAKNVLGFKELDPVTLEPEIRKDEQDNEYRVWIQFRGDAEKQRELVDGNVIYISWARGNFISRLSYVERLVRAFNMLRTMENSRIIWNVINSQFRMKVIVPIGTQSEVKARTRLSELRAMYKEDVTIDYHSGEVIMNGTPNFSFAKQYIIPSREGTQTEIDSVQPAGWDLSGTMALDYFWKRFIIETKVPKDRFSTAGDEGGTQANWTTGGEGIAREEIRFSYFINRIRSILQEILLKPTWIQFCLKHPIFAKDKALKGAIGLEFVEENLFTEAKKREIAKQGSAIVTELMNIHQPEVDDEGKITYDGMYFDPKFLVEKYMNFTEEDLKLNAKYKKERREQLTRISDAIKRIRTAKGEGEEGEGGMGGGFGGGGGEDLGGGMDLGAAGVPEEPGGGPGEGGGGEEAGGETNLGI